MYSPALIILTLITIIAFFLVFVPLFLRIIHGKKVIEPFGFGDTLYFVDNAMFNKFQVVKGKVIKVRKEETTTEDGNDVTNYSYQMKIKEGKSNFINEKYLSRDLDNILSQLNILSEVKNKYQAR